MPFWSRALSSGESRSVLRYVWKISQRFCWMHVGTSPKMRGNRSSFVHPESPGDFPDESFRIAYATFAKVTWTASLVSSVRGCGSVCCGKSFLSFSSSCGV